MMVAASDHAHTVAVVPARGGSKRIPRKNIKLLGGVPLIARTIGMLLEAAVFDRVVVSTDDQEVAEVATDAGAEVPFVRPASLADDHAGTRPVIEHAIRAIEDATRRELGYVCAVYPAAVFVTADDLVDARDMLLQREASFVVAATTFAHPIQRAFTVQPDGLMAMVDPAAASLRSQDLDVTYHDAGQFYWGAREAWLSDVPLLGPSSRAFVMPRWRVHDIDTSEDWEIVERLSQVMPGP